MGNVAENRRRDEAVEILELDAFEEIRASRFKGWISEIGINEHVRIDKQRRPGGNRGEVHGDSNMPNSGSSAIFRKISGSPVHLREPAWLQMRLACGLT